ncbi:hypothetical protein [Halorubrum tebenquichense]|uniref:Uncharacterized protein n=1 Tax=Halorubrum tebenquichense DSM 14210 TaxID=1227485 RepID=M0DUR1_9EURY|nr:hypothetical protein [Halorubrum tebenquichense]ELZ39265.1 hypothetical protein C472_05085 [Halorubrum tebenquichense DSM 14210]
MKRALLVAAGVGLLVAAGVHRLVSSVPVSAGTAAIYAGVTYFYVAFDLSLLAEAPRFDDRVDRLGYGIGLFGVSTSPLLFAHYTGGGDGSVLGFTVAFVGTVAFLTLSEQARRVDDD